MIVINRGITVEEARAAVEQVRTEVLQALGRKPLSPEEPFLGDLTLGQYLELSDESRARLWDQWSEFRNSDFGIRNWVQFVRLRG